MKKTIKVVIVIVILILENALVWYIVDFNYNYQEYQRKLKSNEGLTEACKSLEISEDLFSVLQKLDDYSPRVGILYDKINLSFNDSYYSDSATSLLFDRDNKLTNKACGPNWEPEIPSFKVIK